MRCRVSTVALAALILLPVSSLAKTKIGELDCGPNEIAKFDGTGWVCSDDLNALSQAIEEIGEFGCSAAQQGNSVLISCGDGTAGVIAGAGTVVLYPEGQIGQVPPIDYNTGPIVLIDGSGGVLGEAYEFSGDNFEIRLSDSFQTIRVRLINSHSIQQVVISGVSGSFFFQSEDCSGPAFAISAGGLWEVDNRFFIMGPAPQVNLVFRSVYNTGYWNVSEDGRLEYSAPTECLAESGIAPLAPVVEYFLPPEIVNAVYPVRVEQLP